MFQLLMTWMKNGMVEDNHKMGTISQTFIESTLNPAIDFSNANEERNLN